MNSSTASRRSVLAALAALPTSSAADAPPARAAQASAAGLPGHAAGADPLRPVPGRRLPDRQRRGGERQQARPEARLKGAGMHWAPAPVDPMVALRTVECADRWAEAWPRLGPALRARPRTAPGPPADRLTVAPVSPPPLAPSSGPAPTPPKNHRRWPTHGRSSLETLPLLPRRQDSVCPAPGILTRTPHR